VKVSIFPDGGLTRLGLFDSLPNDVASTFLELDKAKPVSYEEKVPQTNKPLFIKYYPDEKELTKNWAQIKKGNPFNNASAALGATIIKATDEHYSPASLVISPFAPINMFDGMESARSRIPGHFEEVIVKLAKASAINRVELDFTFFVNNNPLEIEIDGLSHDKWIRLIERKNVKAFAGNKISFNILTNETIEQVRLRTFPCGGLNRLKIYSTL